MNNTDNTNFWDYPLYYRIFVIFTLIYTAMTDLRKFFILILTQKLLNYSMALYCLLYFLQ